MYSKNITPHFCFQVHMFEGKGRGIVTTRKFYRGEFVVEYAGQLITMEVAKEREKLYAQDQNTGCYMYYFRHGNSQYW
jgi:SET domain.